ncbi:MAG: acetyl-CoA carboxylase biotin carboxylase subunit [Pseudomonadota bacterium]|nr:acetyl-CoA carboxylase biotin carboxylase subunit [Pseudomonadota bacterium]
MQQDRIHIRKVLVANRGEIACRVMRTLRRMGIESVAVYSDADAQAQHVLAADEAHWIGPAPATESYLDMARILAVAEQAEVDAIHPGYGFLSENAEFARRCAAANIRLIGPPPEAMEAMASKSRAKAIMGEADVPLVPGYHGDDQTPERLLEHAREIGFPVLLKAALGGGGKGMRLVPQEAEFMDALEACQREARAAFGDDHILIEKYITQPRHVEIQVFADMHDNAVYLFERDCSIQRRHQKVVEEAPAPGLDDATRRAMGEAAVRAARAIGYVGAGTIEFLLSASGEYYFMEMNTRLQVEHPVTEMITGLDLVEWQVRVAEGQPLPQAQEQLTRQGHAIEVRIYAEDTAQGFLPSTGTIEHLHMPAASEYVRIDPGVVAGDEISVYYDPMIAKLIVWGDSREAAIRRMLRALQQCHLAGVATNIGFLRSLIEHSHFQSGAVSTHFIEDHAADLAYDPPQPAAREYILGALLISTLPLAGSGEPWQELSGFQLNDFPAQRVLFEAADGPLAVDLELQGGSVTARCGEETYRLDVRRDGDELDVAGDFNLRVRGYCDGDRVALFTAAGLIRLVRYQYRHAQQDSDSDQHLKAPMNGRVVHIAVTEGQQVAKGDLLVTVEAMKMEHSIRAHKPGRVKAVFHQAGDLVSADAELIELEIDEEE